jgi:hypothetical protein
MSMASPPVPLAASAHVGAVQHSPRACVYHRPSCPLLKEADTTPHPPPSGVGTASGTGSPTASRQWPHRACLVSPVCASSLREMPSYMLSHLCGSAASYLVEGSGAHAPPPRFLRAPSLRDGLFVIPVAGGLCPLAWLDGAGCHPSHTVCGLRPLTTFY